MCFKLYDAKYKKKGIERKIVKDIDLFIVWKTPKRDFSTNKSARAITAIM